MTLIGKTAGGRVYGQGKSNMSEIDHSKRALFLAKKFENSTDVLFFMEPDDAEFRNNLNPNEEPNYIFVSNVVIVLGSQHTTLAGHRARTLRGEDGKTYDLYSDYSVGEVKS